MMNALCRSALAPLARRASIGSARFSTLLTQRDAGVLTVTLNRPSQMNAFNTTMRDEIIEVIGSAQADDETRVILVTGAGKAFCAGADLGLSDPEPRGFADALGDYDGSELSVPADHAGMVSLRAMQSSKPLIAAVNGVAVGVGSTMLLPFDYIFASEAARFQFIFTRLGIVPEGYSTFFLPKLVGMRTALDWLVSGRSVSATEALEKGLVNRVCAPECLLPEAADFAAKLASTTSPVAVALTRQMLWDFSGGAVDAREAHQIESKNLCHLMLRGDASEGVASLLAKRRPSFPMAVSSDMPPWHKHTIRSIEHVARVEEHHVRDAS